jgi:SAM-dependent methyltransferase
LATLSIDPAVNTVRVPAGPNPSNVSLRCRICSSERITKRADVEFYTGYAWPIYDCDDCGCAFTRHDDSTYDFLYSERSSCYSRYTEQAATCKALFDRGDRAGLRIALLEQGSKYRFIIDEIESEPGDARLLEIGSSRGHLTSYFILTGRDIIGADVAPNAVAAATAAFGDHFVQTGSPLVEAGAPYDVIFHVGTIGCVADPIGMTERLLGLLKPGGRLLFNAPNRDARVLRDQLWFESAPPPDVVTLFPPGFWSRHFGGVASVTEEIEFCSPVQNILIALRKVGGRKWRRPVPIPLSESQVGLSPSPRITDMLWQNFERGVRKVASSTRLPRLAPSYPTEFGLLVQMRKK